MVELKVLEAHLARLLRADDFKDYCPNGLQVFGRREILRLVTGVTASQALLDAAITAKADAILVHHGYFWRGEDAVLTGMKYQRIKTLIQADVSLFAYHLPLDAHPELGNNAQLANLLGFSTQGVMGSDGVGNWGEVATAQPLAQLSEHISKQLGREALAVSGGDHLVRKVAWCTGGAQGFIEKAWALGADTYISGEISEPTAHAARELGIHYIAAGHHATERYGVQAVGAQIAEAFNIEHQFIDIDNPA